MKDKKSHEYMKKKETAAYMKDTVNVKTMEEIMVKYHDTVICRSRGDGDLIGTGFSSLDFYIRGLKKGELTLVFGKAAHGKTAFMLQCALNLAKKSGSSILLFSPENPADCVAGRLIAVESGIRHADLLRGSLKDTEWLGLSLSCKALSRIGVTVSDASYLPLRRLDATVKEAVREKKADIILIDSLEFLGYNESAGQKVKALKRIAADCDVPVICSCKIPHTEKNTDAYMRKTGEAADTAIMISRDLYRDNGRSKETYFTVKKNRNGMTGCITMNFDFDRLIYREQYEQETE